MKWMKGSLPTRFSSVYCKEKSIKSFLQGSLLSQLILPLRKAMNYGLTNKGFAPTVLSTLREISVHSFSQLRGCLPRGSLPPASVFPPHVRRASSSKKRLPRGRVRLKCLAGLPPRNSHLPRQPALGIPGSGLDAGGC